MITHKNARHFSIRQLSELDAEKLCEMKEKIEYLLADTMDNYEWILAGITLKRVDALEEYSKAEKKINQLNNTFSETMRGEH